jgi:acyl-CoA synthetase (AMP-forming)/AMP-acid ligase II
VQTYGNIDANTRSIVRYLGIGEGDRALAILPFHYCYGKSVLQTHLLAGGSVFVEPRFMYPRVAMESLGREGCTGFAGVPTTFEILRRDVDVASLDRPRLRYLTQAGGRMHPETIRWAREAFGPAELFVMYGQTEATARIAYVPPERLGEKPGSIGIPIPDGALSLAPVEDAEHEELVYRGPNVMLGYAECADALAAGDELRGTLRTGDLARCDDEGFFYLTGRLSRIAKLFGRRISLEDVEKELEAHFPLQAAATESDGRLLVHAAARDALDLPAVQRHLAQQLAVPPPSIRVVQLAELPRTASGKKDYGALSS